MALHVACNFTIKNNCEFSINAFHLAIEYTKPQYISVYTSSVFFFKQ